MGYRKHLQDQIQSGAVAAGAVVICPICGGYPISTGDDAARGRAIEATDGAAAEMADYIDGALSLCPNCGIPAGSA
jgi:uncharacterized protein (DUF983 family)